MRSTYGATLLRGLLLAGLLVVRVSTAPAQVADSSFVQTFTDTLNLRLLWVSKGFDLRARHTQQPGTLLYLPRYRPRIGIGGFLWNVGFNLLLPLALPGDTDNRRVKRFDFQGSLFARRWLINGAFHRYQGFFIRPTGVLAPTDTDQFYEQLVTKKIQASITYLPGGNQVSLRSPYNQGVRQRKSSGSLLLSGSGTYLTLRDSADVTGQGGMTRADAPLSQVRIYALSTKIGYTANLIHNAWFVHLFAATGLDWQQIYYRQTGNNNAFLVEPNLDLRCGLGYDSGRAYAGVYGAVDYNQFQAGDWQFQGTSGQLRIFFGIRFAEPSWLRRRKPQFLEDLQNSPNIPLPPIFG